MKCVLTGLNASVLASAIQSFNRIGSVVFLQADRCGLSMKTVNATNSAFAMISFHPGFFTQFNYESNGSASDSHCTLSLKSLMGIFSNMRQVGSVLTNHFNQLMMESRLGGILQNHFGCADVQTDNPTQVSIGNCQDTSCVHCGTGSPRHYSQDGSSTESVSPDGTSECIVLSSSLSD